MTTQKKAERENRKKLVKQQAKFADKLKKAENFYEQLLWEHLRACQMGVNFRAQVALHPTKYVADFYCSVLRLDIEVDGSIHALPEKREKDKRRDERLEAMGIRVIRIPTPALKEKRLPHSLAQIRKLIEERQADLGGVVA